MYIYLYVYIFVCIYTCVYIHIYLQITLWMQGLFLFSIVWSVGGLLMGDSRKKFDLYFRYIFDHMTN